MPSFVSPSNMKLLHLVVYRMHWSRMCCVSITCFCKCIRTCHTVGYSDTGYWAINSNKEADQRFPINCKSASALLVKDLSYLRASPTWSSKTYPAKSPEEYQRYLTGMNQVLKLSWQIANVTWQNSQNHNNNNNNNNCKTLAMADDRTRLQALSLINDCHKYMPLTTNGVVVTHAI